VDFEKLATEHKDAVYRQMLRVCGNREDAEDVLVEALLKAYRHLGQLRDVTHFRPWLAAIGKRVCWQVKEREALLPLIQLSALADGGTEIPGADAGPEAQAALAQMRVLLKRVLDGLEPQYRQVYEMRELKDMKGEDVARKLGISLAAMKSRLHRARSLVRQGIDAEIMPGTTPSKPDHLTDQ